MAKDLTALMQQHRSQLASEWPWIWLFELEVPTTPATRYRLTNNTRQITFGTNSLGESLVYYPFPIFHGGIDQDSSGNLPSLSISIGNFTREISQALADHNGLIGQDVVIRLVQTSELTNAQAQIREDAVIRSVRVTNEVATFTLAAGNLYERKIPPFRISSVGCRHLYGGPACGYNLDLGGLSTCSKTIDGDNGCRSHGDDEVATGQERKHPKRFGAFPGVRGIVK